MMIHTHAALRDATGDHGRRVAEGHHRELGRVLERCLDLGVVRETGM